jgi:hypothetical protein
MAELAVHCPKFLTVLHGFYTSAAAPPTQAELIAAAAIPQPYRRLLAHTDDMTSTLTKHHGEKLALRVLDRHIQKEVLSRHIYLETVQTRRPVEYGAIRIRLDVLDEKVRREVLECETPLGGILNAAEVCYRSCPGGFFKVASNELINRVFRLSEPHWLYGRCNCLSDGLGRAIAEVVEILPPEKNQQTAAGGGSKRSQGMRAQ